MKWIQQVCILWPGVVFFVISHMLQRPVYAGETSGSVELGVQQTTTSNSAGDEIKSKDITQRYNLDYADYLYRPWLADYRIGGTLSKISTDKETKGESQDIDTELSSYRFYGKLFPYSPFPLSMYIIENDTDVSVQSEADSSVDMKLYGADLKLDFYTLPTTNLFYYGQTTRTNLSSVLSEQDSTTAGINMSKRWDGLTANLRYENSDYNEKYTRRTANSDRLSGNFVYRPTDTFQTSFVYTQYQREADAGTPGIFDPLYSDRDSRSQNLSMLWNPDNDINIGLYANYYLENYETTRREAKDGRASIDYRLTDNLSTFVSTYELHTTLNGERYDSRDERGGLAYNRTWVFGMLELQARTSGGYFNRTIESDTEIEQQEGGFHQLGGRVSLNIQVGSLMLSPYYDVNYGYHQQSNIHTTKSTQQDSGFVIDGLLAGGRLNGSVSYTKLDQENDVTVRSEQLRSYLSYEHRVLRRANVRVSAGKYYSKGYVENNTFESFTRTDDTETRTSYGRVDFTSPVYGTNILCVTSYRKEKRTARDGLDEQNELIDIRFTHQFGKLFSEAGYMKKNSHVGDVVTNDAIWFVKIRRDFSIGNK